MANYTDWLNISQMSGGTGETSLTLTALTNSSLSSKTATVTAKNTTYNVEDTTTVTIEGFVPTLTLSRSTLRFDSTGGTATFTVYSNTAWTIQYPSLVYDYSASAGTGDTEVTVILAPNPDEVSKVDTGIVKDVYNINQLYLTVVQESFIVQLTVTPDEDIEFVNTGSTTSVTIDCNADWEIEYPNWVTPSVTSGTSGTTTVTFTAGRNGDTDRSGTITIYAGSKYVDINVFQPFFIDPYITVTPTAYTFPYTASSNYFVVNSYPGWVAEIISTGDTVWGQDIAFEVTMEIPSAVTVNLGQVGAIINGVVVPGSTYTFEEPGTYKVVYPFVGDSSPVLSGNTYITEVVITDVAETISDNAFKDCTNLSSVTFGSEVKYIGSSAFANCTGLSAITLSPFLEEIGRNAFSGCSNLSNIKIDTATPPYIYSNTFYGVASGGTLEYPLSSDYSPWLNCSAYRLGYYGWNNAQPQRKFVVTYLVTSPTEPVHLHNNYVYGPSYTSLNITSVTLDDGTQIEPTAATYTFERTGKIKVTYNLEGDENVIWGYYKLGNNAYGGFFEGCPDMVEIEFYEGVKEIAANVFDNTPNITACSLGYGIQVLRDYPGYDLIERIELPDSITAITEGACEGCFVLQENFKNHTQLNEYFNGFWGARLIDERTTDGLLIRDNVVIDCTHTVSDVIIPKTVRAFKRSLFRLKTSLKSVHFESGNAVLTEFPDELFQNCNNLEELELPPSLLYIGWDCFENCGSLSSITAYGLVEPDGYYNFIDVSRSSGCVFSYPFGADYETFRDSFPSNWVWTTFSLDYDLCVGPETITVPSAAISKGINIDSSSAWTISSSDNWITFSANSGESGVTAISVNFSAYEDEMPTGGTITVSNGTTTKTIQVVRSLTCAPLLISQSRGLPNNQNAMVKEGSVSTADPSDFYLFDSGLTEVSPCCFDFRGIKTVSHRADVNLSEGSVWPPVASLGNLFNMTGNTVGCLDTLLSFEADVPDCLTICYPFGNDRTNNVAQQLTSVTFTSTDNVTAITNFVYYQTHLVRVKLGNISRVSKAKNVFSTENATITDFEVDALPGGNNINWGFDYLVNLTVDSLVNILNALPTTATRYWIKIGATNIAKLSPDQLAIATNKGWEVQ